MKRIGLILGLLVMVFTGFARRIAPVAPTILDGTYSVQKLWDGEKLADVSKIKTTVTYDSKSGVTTAFFGCNRMSGSFQLTRYSIAPVQLMSTEMFCSNLKNRLESNYGLRMGEVNHFTIEGLVVTFYQDDQVRIILKKQGATVVKKKKKKKRK